MNIEYAVTTLDEPSNKESKVSVEIAPEARFNSFSGATIQFVVQNKTKKQDILERVKRKVLQETGTNIEETGGKFIERSAL